MLQREHSAILLTFIKLPLILSLRSSFCLFLSGRFTQVLLVRIYPKYSDTKELRALRGYSGPHLKLKIERCVSLISPERFIRTLAKCYRLVLI